MVEKNLKERYLSAKRKLFDIHYARLNEEQREAVFTTEGSLLVLAGAGSGKTTVLVNRIVFIVKYGNAYFSEYVPYDISEQRVAMFEKAADYPPSETEELLNEFISSPCAPWQILAITFTNKAANEIKTRLESALGDPDAAKSIWAGTFHSMCMRILRVYGDRLGYDKNFTVYDTADSKSAVTEIMKSLNIDEKALSVKAVMNEMSRAKDNLMTAEMYEKENGGVDYRRRQIARIYKAYAERLKSSNALDFDDIIMQTVLLLERDSEVREYYQNKFRYIAVDEFQDTNIAQFRLIELLSGGHKNIMVVGDDDQSIYKFRGAVIENILGFDKRFKDTKIIKLEHNYRSTEMILKAANAVISKNMGRKGKALWTDRGIGEKIILRNCEDQNAEARYISDKIVANVGEEICSYKDCAILYRTNAQSNIIERTFAKSGIPYRMLGGLRFNDRKEIKDIVAYLQFVVNPADKERFKRIVNEPKRGIGTTAVSAVIAIAEENNLPVFEVVKNADKYAALSRSAKKLKEFGELISSFAQLLSTDIKLEEFVKQVISRSGYRKMLVDGGEEERERLENVEEFVSGVIDYENNNDEPTLVGFLEENALVAEVDKYDESADAVVMMTIHSAKGLEFPIVFLPGMEDGIFPGIQNITAGPEEMEEERRLAYVAITRAKDRLYITHAKLRMLYGRTQCNPVSRFVEEIPAELIHEDIPMQRYSYGKRYDAEPKVYFSINDTSSSWGNSRSFDFTAYNKTPTPKKGNLSLVEGDRVFHVTFGEGEILSAKPMGADVLYEVAFDKFGTKKLMGTFAKLKKID